MKFTSALEQDMNLIWCSGSFGDLFIILSLLKNTFKMVFLILEKGF
jgi:hypothetical protein